MYFNAFLIGGIICAIAQVLIDTTKLTPAKILVLFVTVGAFMTSLGWYQWIVDFGEAGATIPLTGFGYSLAKGTFTDVDKYGIFGAFTGGIKAAAAGITAAVFFGYIISITSKPKAKR